MHLYPVDGIVSATFLAAAGDVAANGSITVSSIAVLGILASAGGVIAFLFRALITSKDRELTALTKERDKALLEKDSMLKSLEEIATESVLNAKETANFYLGKIGLPPVPMVAPVISESQSPSTAAQRSAAHIQTLRATMAAIKLTLGQEPRPEPNHAPEPVKPSNP